MNNFVDHAKAFKTQFALNFGNKILVDFFAGGGGASTGLEIGLNASVFAAVNHNPKALSMHEKNHPHAKHFVQDVFAVDPVALCEGHEVAWFHASPDCTHHSQAAGGQPRKKEIRDLSWVAVKFAGKVRPDVISLENVKQILNWGPLIAKRDKATGRVITLEKIEVNGKKVHRVAEPGEHVPRHNQFLVPNPKRKSKTWHHFVRSLEKLGYVVEWKKLIAADFGAPTTRERLFLVARCDGQPIVWPSATHFKNPKLGQKKWRSAAECIDFDDLGRSIFDREKPLANATCKRIARGMFKFVLEAKEPYLVKSSTPFITEFANASQQRNLVSAYMMQANGGFCETDGRSLDEPLSTITNTGSQQQLVSAVFTQAYYGDKRESDHRSKSLDSPLCTIPTENRHSLVSVTLSKDDFNGAMRVATFLINYYGNGDARDIQNPLDTITTKDRLALVTIWIKGEPWVIVDIRMRMLKPRELYLAQGFPPNYVIDIGHDGKSLSKKDQVHMVGNSVSPEPMAAIARANNPFIHLKVKGAA